MVPPQLAGTLLDFARSIATVVATTRALPSPAITLSCPTAPACAPAVCHGVNVTVPACPACPLLELDWILSLVALLVGAAALLGSAAGLLLGRLCCRGGEREHTAAPNFSAVRFR